MTMPLLAVIIGLVAYPAAYGIYLSMLNRRMTEFAGTLNFELLFESDTFWMVAFQSCFFAITAVLLNLFLNGAKHDEAAVIAAAKQAEAH